MLQGCIHALYLLLGLTCVTSTEGLMAKCCRAASTIYLAQRLTRATTASSMHAWPINGETEGKKGKKFLPQESGETFLTCGSYRVNTFSKFCDYSVIHQI